PSAAGARRTLLPGIRVRRRSHVRRALAMTVAAAGIVALIRWSEWRTPAPEAIRPFVERVSPRTPEPAHSTSALFEVQLHEWANGFPVRPADAARTVLLHSERPHHRAPTEVEILAIELANQQPGLSRAAGPLAARRTVELRPKPPWQAIQRSHTIVPGTPDA